MNFALAQVTTSNALNDNLIAVLTLMEKAKQEKASAILFPENVLFMGEERHYKHIALIIMKDKIIERIQAAAKENSIAVLIGSYMEFDTKTSALYNTSLWINEKGRILGKYRKIHLFDVITPSGERYRESRKFRAGNKPVVFVWNKLKIGLSICYDLRFPDHYQKLCHQGAQCLMVPSAFTQETGAAHWHTLLKSRAIENFAFVFAPAQTGTHATGRKTYGHSLAVSPWGATLSDAGTEPGLSFVKFDACESAAYRKKFGWK